MDRNVHIFAGGAGQWQDSTLVDNEKEFTLIKAKDARRRRRVANSNYSDMFTLSPTQPVDFLVTTMQARNVAIGDDDVTILRELSTDGAIDLQTFKTKFVETAPNHPVDFA